ncbi:MAG: LacI family DNA-binding transcriptional regulator [Chloroflexota bacterium]
MAVTINDIAKIAGVSHTTVSRALKGHPALATKTIERIRQIADELGYVPNTVARGLKTNRSRILGVVVRRIGDPYFTEVQRGIEDVLHNHDYRMIIASSQKSAERESEIVRAMSEHRVDGVIICSSRVDPKQKDKLEKFGMPTVFINSPLDGGEVFTIQHDDVQGYQALVQHLVKLGHTQIGYLGHALAGKTNAQRLNGFTSAMSKAKLSINPAYMLQSEKGAPEDGEKAIRPLLTMDSPPTALVCYNDMLALGATHGLRAGGWQLPADCSITGFDNIEISSFLNPPLTTWHQPRYEMGQQAATLMLDYLRCREAGLIFKPQNKMMRGELIIRQSTQPNR